MALRIFIIRHGETEWSISGQHTGRTDIALTENGEEEARKLGSRIEDIEFTNVFVSPLKRARRTCELAGLINLPRSENGLIEWDYGDYESRTSADIRKIRPGWNLFHDGCPKGEMPSQVSSRVDRLIESLRKLDGNVAIFTHGHVGRVLAARWIGLSVDFAQHFLLNTASLSILSYEHFQQDQPAILLWNSTSAECLDNSLKHSTEIQAQLDWMIARRRAIERWENEGGEVLHLDGELINSGNEIS